MPRSQAEAALERIFRLTYTTGLERLNCDTTYRMTIPHADRAMVDIRKLRDYCLNPLHDEGQHKARVFAAALGITIADAEVLRDML